MIAVAPLRELKLTSASSKSRALHLSAASGLVYVDGRLYVVADDELHLGVFSAAEDTPGRLLRLFEGELPEKYKKRKAEKPDLETLTHLPAFAGFPYGALLALGSGSKLTRERGVLLGLDARGMLSSNLRHVDLSVLYDRLRAEIAALNIEGAVVQRGRLQLLQRGNKGSANALIECDLTTFLDDLAADIPPRIQSKPTITVIDLGEVQGVPLCFSDGAALPNGDLIFSAVAENTDNPIDDGACAGSAIGVLGPNGTLKRIERLAVPHKIEGISADVRADGIHALLVTDGDDASKPAWLLSAMLKGW
jgi:hypothetical protein